MNAKQLLVEGLTDAAGFVVGAMLAFGIGKLFSLDIFAPGYSNGTMLGIVLLGLGGGVGLQAARRIRTRQTANSDRDGNET